MATPNRAKLIQEEGRIILALEALRSQSIHGIQNAARCFNVKYSTLRSRHAGIQSQRDCQPNSQKLTRLEEQTMVRYILDLDLRGFSPILAEVADMANKLLKAREQPPVGINWPSRFVARQAELKMSFSRVRDYQRVKQEDPAVISAWFRLVANTKMKYGI